MKKSAFSLLELSVSLVVVSLLMAMVLQGIKMVASSRLTTARSLTSKSPVPNIPGLVAWYETTSVDSLKAAEAVDGKRLGTWYDISPDSIPARKNTLTRTASSSAVVFESDGINNLPSVKFNGNSSGIGLANFYQGSSSQNTVFYAIKPSLTSGIIVDSGPSANNVAAFGLDSSTQLHFNYGGPKNIPISPLTLLTNQDYLGATYYNGANSKAFINNATTMINGGVVFDPGPNSLQGIMIGSDRDNFYAFTGLISEIIVYNRPLQTQERKDVMGYLSKKYGIVVTGL